LSKDCIDEALKEKLKNRVKMFEIELFETNENSIMAAKLIIKDDI